MAYSEKVIDHYENPRNVGSFGKEDEGVATGMVGAPACGDVMKLQIKVNKHGIIEDAKFKTYGCGSAIASSSLVTEWVKGKSVDEAAGTRRASAPAPSPRTRSSAWERRSASRARRWPARTSASACCATGCLRD